MDTNPGAGNPGGALNPQAQAEVEAAVLRYRNDLIEQASRLEEALNSARGAPEITGSMVRDADLFLRRGYVKRRRGKGLITAQIFSPVGALCAGLLADETKLKNPLVLILFILLLAVTISATVFAALTD